MRLIFVKHLNHIIAIKDIYGPYWMNPNDFYVSPKQQKYYIGCIYFLCMESFVQVATCNSCQWAYLSMCEM